MAVAFVRDHTGTSVKVAGTTNTNVNISTATGIGNLLVVRILFDNAAVASKPVVSNIDKAAGETNNWVFLGAARSTSTSAGAFASGEQWAIRTSVSWPVANYIITLDTTTVMKAARVTEYSGATATLRSTSGTAYSTTTTAASATTTGTTPVIGDLALGFLFGSNVGASQAGDNDTLGGTWSIVTGVGSTGGSAATNNWGVGQDKILTTASHQTYNNSAAMTAGNGAIVAILQQYVDPAITLAAYRFYADGTETASTALAAQDATPTVDVSSGDVNAQLRVRLQSTSAAEAYPTDDFQLQWEKNGSGSWANLNQPVLAESYPETNMTGSLTVSTAGITKMAQQVAGNGKPLTRAGFYVDKYAAPDGVLTAELWASSAALGAGTAKPSGAGPLAVSTTSTPTSAIPTGLLWAYFDFDGTFTLGSGTPYFIVVSTTNTVASSLAIGYDGTPTHPGTFATYSASAWTNSGWDLIFAVYSPGGVGSYDSPNLTDAAATTNRLTGGTGTFTAGKVSEDGLADNVGWAGNNYTELLYSLTFKQADLANGDTIRFRVLRNGATTGLTYTQTPTVTITKATYTPVGSFTASASSVVQGSTVTFTDTSTFGPTSWAWDFGVGASPATATTKGPHTVTYSTLGTSTVSLTVSNTAGSDAADNASVWVSTLITQNAYRFYADGTETGSTALAAQDTAPTVDVSSGDINLQLRTRLQSPAGAVIAATDDFQLQWERNASGTWANASSLPLDEQPLDTALGARVGISYARYGQTFLGAGVALRRAVFGLRGDNLGASTANYTAQVFACSGLDQLPTGSALTVSAPVSLSSLPQTPTTMVPFTFDGSFTPGSGTAYAIVVAADPSETADVQARAAIASVHPGICVRFLSGAWSSATSEPRFALYGPDPSTVAPYDSPNLTDAAATTNRLTGGTGTFVAGKVSEDGLVDDLGWSGSAYIELLYSLTLKQADLANSDTIRFRILRNGVTTGFTYTATPTVTVTKGGGGPVTPVASFTASASTVTTGGTVTFTDTSTNTPTTWAWNFGAGATPATAATQGPHTVTYSTAGTSTVTLTAGNTAGSDAVDVPTSITVTAVPLPTRNIRLGNAALQRSFTR